MKKIPICTTIDYEFVDNWRLSEAIPQKLTENRIHPAKS